MTSVKNYVNLVNKYDRIVVLVDMDCFYCQVEEKLNPDLKGKPIAVVQYNEWKGGGIIAVNYPARAKGVTRHMRGDEAKEHCPEIELCRVPCVRGKADLTKYREAGKDVAAVLQSFTPLLERASVDEAYLDITETVTTKLKEMNEGKFKLDASKFTSTFAVGYNNMGDFVNDITNQCDSSQDFSENFENESEHEKSSRKRSDVKLLIAAAVVNDIRAAVKEKTSFECSAGIAHNKILAKLTAGMNKPNKQTVLPLRNITEMFATLPISKVKGLGGKFGEQVSEIFKIKHMGELLNVPKEELHRKFDEKNGTWLYLMARGVDLECVTPRYTSKSIGCCKKFPGKSAITGMANLNHWLLELSTEICERLEKDLLENNRTAKQMTISFTQTIGTEDVSSSRTVALTHYDPEPIAKEALDVIKRNTTQFCKPDNMGALNNHIKFLGISVGKFENNVDHNKKSAIQTMFENKIKKSNPVEVSSVSSNNNEKENDSINSKANDEPKNATVDKTAISEIIEQKKHTRKFNFQEETAAEPSSLEQMFKNHMKTTLQTTENSIEPITMQDIKEDNHIESNNKPKSFLLEYIENKRKELLSCIESKNKSTNAEISNQETASSVNLIIPIASTSREHDMPSDEMDIQLPEEYDFVLPEIEVPLIQCATCKRKIPEDEVSSHQDYHFALNLSQQQREEFRSEIKNKFSSPQNSQLPKTTKSDKLKAEKIRPIQEYLKKLNTSQEDDEEVEEETVKCSECEKFIKLSCMHEHSDYHLARKLQQEMNQMEANRVNVSNNKKAGVAVSSNKRKRPATTNNKSNSAKLKPLTKFFEKIE